MAKGGTSFEQVDVERLVRQVLAELTAGPKQAAKTAVGGELVLTGKVVSLAEVEGRLTGVMRVVVPRGAVFTPAARDELKKRQVAIASAVTKNQKTAGRQLTIGVAETSYEPASLIQMLSADGVRVEQLPRLGLTGVVTELCEQVVKGGQFGLLVTEQTAAALCLANRQRGVRAALGSDARAVAAAVATVAANLLVIDAAGKSQFELKQILRTWLTGQPNCPSELRQRLD